MTTQRKPWVGLGGVPPGDNALAHLWEKRLHWPMIGEALLSVPSLFLEDLTQMPGLQALGKLLEVAIFLAFASEFLRMMRLTSHRSQYAIRNWLDVLSSYPPSLILPGGNSSGWQLRACCGLRWLDCCWHASLDRCAICFRLAAF